MVSRCPVEAAPIAVRHSVLDERALAALLIEAFDLPDPVTCHLARLGLTDEYRVVAGGHRHRLRVWPAGSADEEAISWQLDLAAKVEPSGVIGAAPVRRHDGRILNRLEAPEGVRFAVLFAIPVGRGMTSSADDWKKLGAAVAALHGAADGFSSSRARSPLDADHVVGPIARSLESMLRERPSDGAALQAALTRLADVLENTADKLDWGPCHGASDGSDALIVDNERAVLLDLSQAAPGWRVWDLATAVDAARRRGGSASAEAVLDGYLCQRPLVDPDLALVDAVGSLRALWHVGRLASASSWIGTAAAEAAWAEIGLPAARSWA